MGGTAQAQTDAAALEACALVPPAYQRAPEPTVATPEARAHPALLMHNVLEASVTLLKTATSVPSSDSTHMAHAPPREPTGSMHDPNRVPRAVTSPAKAGARTSAKAGATQAAKSPATTPAKPAAASSSPSVKRRKTGC